MSNCNTPIKHSSHIGTSLLYTKINDPNYEFVNEYEQLKNPKYQLRSITFGHSVEFDNKLVIDLSSNRLFNKDISRSIKYLPTGSIFLNKTQTSIDSLSLGKRFNRFVPMFFIANVEISKSIYDGNSLLVKTVNHTYFYGFNFITYVNKKISISLFVIAPNKVINLELGGGVGISYSI